jgi:hypothetical protein
MSLNTVNNAISKLVVDTRLDVVGKVNDFLKEKLEMSEDELADLIEEFKNTLDLKVKELKVSKVSKDTSAEEKPKKKRVAGPYNLFLGEQIKQFKLKDPESKESKKFMSMAQQAWKDLKAKYPEHEKDSAKLFELWKEDNNE